MCFTAKSIFNKQERITNSIDRAIIRDAKRLIKNKIIYKINHSKDVRNVSFFVDNCASALNYTYKEFKQPFYDKVIPYFKDKGFIVEINTETEECTISWSK
jgi:hypothetical protein